MSNYHTVRVPHLGGITAAYQTPKAYDTSKPTILLVNSFVTSSELFRPQFEDENLTNAVNLIAIDPLGHGYTRTKAEQWTFWDTAIMNFEVLTALGIRGKVFVLGVGQGGCVTARMALLAPRKVRHPSTYETLKLPSLIDVSDTDRRHHPNRHINGRRERTHTEARLLERTRDSKPSRQQPFLSNTYTRLQST